MPDLSAEEFLHSLKPFVVRRGRSEKIFTGNGKKFVVAMKWLKHARQEDSLTSAEESGGEASLRE